MQPIRERAIAWLILGVAVLVVPATAAERGGMFGLGRQLGGRGPVTVTSQTLEYDYKRNVVTYRGDVRASQGKIRLRSAQLTVTLVTESDRPDSENVSLQEIVASGGVRIDQGTRWATGDKAVFDGVRRILLLTGDPVLHDGQNEIAGDRVVVYLDEDRSVVEGGRRRVKAVLFPGADDETPDSGTSR